MTELAASTPPARTSRRRSVRRTVLSLAAAAIVAASLPFSALYIHALNQHPAAVTATRIVHVGHASGHATVPTTVTTRASGSAAPASGRVATTSSTQTVRPGLQTTPAAITTRAS